MFSGVFYTPSPVKSKSLNIVQENSFFKTKFDKKIGHRQNEF